MLSYEEKKRTRKTLIISSIVTKKVQLRGLTVQKKKKKKDYFQEPGVTSCVFEKVKKHAGGLVHG